MQCEVDCPSCRQSRRCWILPVCCCQIHSCCASVYRSFTHSHMRSERHRVKPLWPCRKLKRSHPALFVPELSRLVLWKQFPFSVFILLLYLFRRSLPFSVREKTLCWPVHVYRSPTSFTTLLQKLPWSQRYNNDLGTHCCSNDLGYHCCLWYHCCIFIALVVLLTSLRMIWHKLNAPDPLLT